MSTKPFLPTWAKIGLAALAAATGLCLILPIMDRNPREFTGPFLACAVPFALFVTFIAFIATAGKRARCLCGYCGYDRAGFPDSAPCPECGRAYDPNSPGYKPVGRRTLPWWVWLPALLPIPGLVLAPRIPDPLQGPYAIGCLGLAVGAIVLAAVHSWRQVR